MDKNKKFIETGNQIHGNRYDYSKIDYLSTKKKVIIICKEHGEFEQTPEKHLNRKQGCPNCSHNKPLTTEEFIKKSTLKHNGKYDYSKVNYINNRVNITIICPIHGEFEQQPHTHDKSGCPKCVGRNKTNMEVINELKLIHGDKYDYSLIDYKSEKSKLEIICSKHGSFYQTFNTHKKGHECPKCHGRYQTKDEFIIKANLKHNNQYSYDNLTTLDFNKKIKINCELHGSFLQKPSSHLSGNGCPKCKGLKITEKKTKTLEQFINEAKNIHGNRYDYSKSIYVGCKNKIVITCSIHGEFEQEPNSHLQGCGCPKCGNMFNETEDTLKTFIKSLNLDIIENTRKIIPPLELDIFIPSHNIAIEFNGIYWHNELNKPSNYHLNKTIKCEEQGVKLIHIFEDEWLINQDIVKSRLKNILGLTENKIFGRKCEIRTVNNKESKIFLDDNHLQGNTNSSIRLGLYYNDELVSLMTFNKPRLGVGKTYDGYELTRFCNKLDTNVIGAASKFLKYFINNFKPKTIISYADMRWSTGDLYDTLGFDKVSINKPNYWYVIGNKRKHRFGFRKHILQKEGFDTTNKTEHEIMLERKIYRIYDCGTITYKKTQQ
jgi:hypothetical protein